MPAAGAEVAWWDRDGRLSFGIVAGEDDGRIRLILAEGRQRRVSTARIAFTIGQLLPPPGGSNEDRARAARRAAALSEDVRAAADSVDVAVLWELALESPDPPDLGAFAELALGRDDGASRAAVAVALADDSTLFVRRGARWEPRSRKTVEGIRLQRHRAAAKASERDKAVGELAAAARGAPFLLSGSGQERRYLRALEEVAIMGIDATHKAKAATLEVLGHADGDWDRPEDGAFRLLRRLGRFTSDDENLQILKYGMRTSFPDEAQREARAAAERGFQRAGRSDLTDLDVITIDGPNTLEIDDGLSVEVVGPGHRRVGIHIADPVAFVDPGGAVDREALARSTSYYFPDRRLPMLPEAISHDASSLLSRETRPALSFLVEVDPSGEIVRYEVARSVVRSRARLDYLEADTILRRRSTTWHTLLTELAAVSSALERTRDARGAVRILAPEIEVRVVDGKVTLERIDPGSPCRRIVAETMILAGAVAARFCLERDVPALYRRQAAPAQPLDPTPFDSEDLVACRARRRGLRRGEVGLVPGSHFALALPAYVQVTSPLRRYQDLAMHRQIIAALEGNASGFDRETLQRIASSTERADHDGRRAEAAADRYWLLRALESRSGDDVEGVVVEVEPRPVVVLLETLLEAPMPGLSGATVGERLHLRIERVNPRADVLKLRRR